MPELVKYRNSDGTADIPVSVATPLPVSVKDLTVVADTINLDTSDVETKLGAVTETAPASDTASSGLNGRLQRIAQRITSAIALLTNITAANMATTTQVDAQKVAHPGEWTVVHNPGANLVATATKAAGAAGVRHVCTSLSFTLGNIVATATLQNIYLRDGASGAGTIIWAGQIGVTGVAGDSRAVTLTGLNIVGSAATAMCIEFASAGGASTYEAVTLTGYSII